MLDAAHVADFIANGFVRIPGAFPRATAEACRDIIWRDIDPDARTGPAIGLGD